MTAIDGDWAGALGVLVLFATNLLAMIVVGAALFAGLAASVGTEATRSPAPPVYALDGPLRTSPSCVRPADCERSSPIRAFAVPNTHHR